MILFWIITVFIVYSECTLFYHNIPVQMRYTQSRIIGGYYVDLMNRVPYQAQVIYKGVQICGATIISEYWLISAAHCFFGLNPSNVIVRTGSVYPDRGEMYKVKQIIVHENFTMRSITDDISLIRLRRPIRFNQNQNKIQISYKQPKVGDEIIISGYGKESQYGRMSPYLKIAYTPVVSNAVCARRYYPTTITNDMFCAGDGITDTCQGDSGGPAVINNKLVGITSFGRDCGSKYYPGVYTKVRNYHDWIWKKMKSYFY